MLANQNSSDTNMQFCTSTKSPVTVWYWCTSL